jgi:hypothetical protein
MPLSRHRKALRDRPSTAASIEKYKSDLQQIVSTGLPEKMPQVLYHYTTWVGFSGIVSSQVFHARAHHCTNDSAELTSLDEILAEIAADLARRVASPLKGPLQAFLRDLPSRKIGKVGKVYLACFSVARDKAVQWERYADGGTGVCLGFKVLFDEKGPDSIASLPVVYDENLWRSALQERFQRVVACHDRFGRSHRGGYRTGSAAAWSALMQIAAIASISAKKPEWSQEEEWRTVLVDSEGEITPLLKADGSEYIELHLRQPPLRFVFDEVILGPRVQPSPLDGIGEARRVLERGGYTVEEMPPITVSATNLQP